jgi:hypothetical protein
MEAWKSGRLEGCDAFSTSVVGRPILPSFHLSILPCLSLFVTALPLLLLSAPRADAAEFAVPLTVTESAGAARRAEPVSGGVPLPKGMFGRDQSFALFREGGGEVACQVTPMVVETDGTVRWVLLDFQDDVAAGATNKYVLKAAAAGAKPATALQVGDSPEAVTVDTGRIRLVIDKKSPFGLFKAVEAGGNAVITGGEISYEQLHGRTAWDDGAKWAGAKKFTAGAPESVKVWYSGPMRVTVEVAGRFPDDPLKAGYKTWITAWAGKSRVLVKHKLCNSNPDVYTVIPVKRAAVELKLAGSGGGGLLGAAGPLSVGGGNGAAWLHQGLLPFDTYQDVPGAARAGSGSKTLWTGDGVKGRPQGWIAVKGAGTLFAWDRTFSCGAPRRLSADGDRLVLESVAEAFAGAPDAKFKRDRLVGRPWKSECYWLFDCTHHSSEYVLDFAAPSDGAALGELARACHDRLWVLAPAAHYSRCQVLGRGHFGTLEDEKACYRKWGWTFDERKIPTPRRVDTELMRLGSRSISVPGDFKDYEDNHYESEADSTEAMLLLYLRSGDRGWFNAAETWARYHTDIQAWRTDGWKWKDGGIWWIKAGRNGVRPQRNTQWNFKWELWKKDTDCQQIFDCAESKACYCHYYGSGLADYYCLTGDRDALEAAVDDVEQKENEYRQFRKFDPGKTPVGCIRGFGRGFEVMLRVLEADPGNKLVADLADLCARTLWGSPLIDERGFHCCKIGGGFGGMKAKDLTPKMKEWMKQQGISAVLAGDTVDSLKKGEKTWKVHCLGGSWMHIYVQNGADAYARRFDDEDMRDFTVAFAQFSAKFMRSRKCHQTWYYAFMDVPDLGRIWDPWEFEHTGTKDGEGCVHSGHYTCFYPDACAKGYSWTGEKRLLEEGKLFWHYGSRRNYKSKKPACGPDQVYMFAGHVPPKTDKVLETARLFYEWSHPREDAAPPAAITDLKVSPAGDRATVSFTAPADEGGGRVARYQVKCSDLPIVSYADWDYARDLGEKRNWWRAANLAGEGRPGAPGAKESFTVTGVPSGAKYFAVRSYDDSWNRSAISNLAGAGK